MIITLAFGIAFLAFCLVRARWHNSWANVQRETHHQRRESFLAIQFTFVILFFHGGWLLLGGFSAGDIQLLVAIRWIAFGLMLLGVVMLDRVHAALGDNFSPVLELKRGHQLIRTGLYSRIRHPMYTSGFLYLFGAGFLSANVFVLLCPLVSFAILVAFRIPDEERMMADRFGDDWLKHKNSTGMFVPKLRFW